MTIYDNDKILITLIIKNLKKIISIFVFEFKGNDQLRGLICFICQNKKIK